MHGLLAISPTASNPEACQIFSLHVITGLAQDLAEQDISEQP